MPPLLCKGGRFVTRYKTLICLTGDLFLYRGIFVTRYPWGDIVRDPFKAHLKAHQADPLAAPQKLREVVDFQELLPFGKTHFQCFQ